METSSERSPMTYLPYTPTRSTKRSTSPSSPNFFPDFINQTALRALPYLNKPCPGDKVNNLRQWKYEKPVECESFDKTVNRNGNGTMLLNPLNDDAKFMIGDNGMLDPMWEEMKRIRGLKPFSGKLGRMTKTQGEKDFLNTSLLPSYDADERDAPWKKNLYKLPKKKIRVSRPMTEVDTNRGDTATMVSNGEKDMIIAGRCGNQEDLMMVDEAQPAVTVLIQPTATANDVAIVEAPAADNELASASAILPMDMVSSPPPTPPTASKKKSAKRKATPKEKGPGRTAYHTPDGDDLLMLPKPTPKPVNNTPIGPPIVIEAGSKMPIVNLGALSANSTLKFPGSISPVTANTVVSTLAAGIIPHQKQSQTPMPRPPATPTPTPITSTTPGLIPKPQQQTLPPLPPATPTPTPTPTSTPISTSTPTLTPIPSTTPIPSLALPLPPVTPTTQMGGIPQQPWTWQAGQLFTPPMMADGKVQYVGSDGKLLTGRVTKGYALTVEPRKITWEEEMALAAKKAAEEAAADSGVAIRRTRRSGAGRK